jgi:integrase/recombinase XerD
MHISSQTSSASLYSALGRRKYLTPPERLRFIAAAMAHPRPELRTLCLVLAYTGCRISEALGLFSASIEADEAFIAIRSLKKRKRVFLIRQVPVPFSLIQLLQQVHPQTGAGTRLWTWSRSRAWQLVKAVMAQAQIPPGLHATPKGLRHGFGVHAVRHGVPLNLIQRWMGHASLTTTAIYLEIMGDEEREIAQRMWTMPDAIATPEVHCSVPSGCGTRSHDDSSPT